MLQFLVSVHMRPKIKKVFRYLSAAAVLLSLAVSASPQGSEPFVVDPDLEAAKQVKDYYAEWLSSIPGVSRVSVARSEQGEPVIKVEVTEESPQTKQIPEKLNGIRVVVSALRGPANESLFKSSQLAGGEGFLPNPTPEAEVTPVPTPEVPKFWPAPLDQMNSAPLDQTNPAP
jgi:hypothetical protein